MANHPENADDFLLHPPFVLRAREVEGYHGGVGIAEVGEDLAIVVYPWLNMFAGQVLSLYLNDDPEPLHIRPILQDEENQNVHLSIEREYLFARTLEIHYDVRDINLQPSQRYRLLIKLDRPGGVDPDPETGISDGLLAPQVPKDIEDFGVGPEHLEAGVEVTIPPFANRSPIQWITLYWGGVSVRQQVQVADPLAPVIIHVSGETILQAGNNAQLPLFYDVRDEVNNWSGHSPNTVIRVVVREGDLPEPLVLDAVEGELDVAALGNRPARVKVETPAPDFLPGDTVRLHWDGIDADGKPVEVMLELPVSNGAGLEFEIANARVRDIVHGLARVSYELLRGNEPPRRSWQTTVRVIGEIFEVYGARSQRGAYYYANFNRLVARSRSGGTVHWRYAGDSSGHEGQSFIDTAPERVLQVTYSSRKSAGRTTVLNLRAGNVAGVLLRGSHDSGCLVKDDGSLFGWSQNNDGLQAPADISGVRFVLGGGRAYAAITRTGGARAWGVADAGGVIPGSVGALLVDVQMIAASGAAFAALLGTGRVQAWGSAEAGGAIPPHINANLINVQQIVGSSTAFAARTAQGRVFCWGAGIEEGEIAGAEGAQQLVANNQAFAALNGNGSVHAWGSVEHGGEAPAGLNNVRLLASTSRAFAALRADGSVVAWGDPAFGGAISTSTRSSLYSAVHLQGSTSAFVVLRADGSLVAWGIANEGGTVPAGLGPVVAVSTGYGGFAALQDDRRAISWGANPQNPGSEEALAVYSAGGGLVALRSGGQIQGWGAAVPDLSTLTGLISYQLDPTVDGFAAVTSTLLQEHVHE
ncbi:hypothetical protein D3C76_179590 [compost metagenome]